MIKIKNINFAQNSYRVSKKSKSKPITLEKIDTPEEVGVLPFMGLTLITTIAKVAQRGKRFNLTGKINDGGKIIPLDLKLAPAKINGMDENPYRFQFIDDEDIDDGEEKISYNLAGTIGEKNNTKINATSSGTTLSGNGNIGENIVNLTYNFNIFSNSLRINGKIGEVNVNLKAYPYATQPTMRGDYNGTEVYEISKNTPDGKEGKGNIGKNQINTKVTNIDENKFKLKETIGTVSIEETVEIV